MHPHLVQGGGHFLLVSVTKDMHQHPIIQGGGLVGCRAKQCAVAVSDMVVGWALEQEMLQVLDI